MDNRYPLMLFCFPASAIAGAFLEALQDGQYGTRIVADEGEHQAALADGWRESAAAARAAHAAALEPEPASPAPPEEAADDTAPPTRAELEAKATELGINFRTNTSDKALADRIAAALEP